MISFPTPTEPFVSLIIVGLRDAPLLERCLASIEETVLGVSYEVILILNDPTPRLQDLILNGVRGVHITAFRANLGFGRAVNFAASKAKGRFLVLVNDDAVVVRDWLSSLLETAERHPEAGIVGGTTLHPDGTIQEAGSILWSDGSTVAVGEGETHSSMRFERRVDYCSGCSFLVRRNVWDDLGGFDDSFYPAYYEDVDLCLRAAERGWEVWYQPRSVAVHERSASTNRMLLDFLFLRGRENFLSRWSSRLKNHESPGNIESAVWKSMGSPLRVLVIDDRIPMPSLGSGFGRMFDALNVMAADRGLHVAFYGKLDEGTTSSFFPVPGIRLIPSLEGHLGTPGVDYDAVIISRPHNALQFLELIAAALPRAALIYDAEALFHRRLHNQASFVTTKEREALLVEAAETERLESRSIRAADRVVCISVEEADIIENLTGRRPEVVEPWLRIGEPTRASFVERAHIGFVAGWAGGPGSPNSDALLWLARDVLPIVRVALPDSRLLVTGGSPPDDVNWLEGHGIDFVGSVLDLAEFYDQIRVAVSPTRFGSGVKLKAIEALQYGVPVVSTLEGAAGIPSNARKAVWAVDDASEFANALISLLSDHNAWSHYRKLALDGAPSSLVDEFGVGRWPAIVREAVNAKSVGKESNVREARQLAPQR